MNSPGRRLLLDTQIVIWMAMEPDRLSSTVRDALAEVEQVGVSVVSAWEYGLKRAKHPRALPRSFESLIRALPVATLDLPWACHPQAELLPPIHADPFDRMLIAHALTGSFDLVTADRVMRSYPVPTLW